MATKKTTQRASKTTPKVRSTKSATTPKARKPTICLAMIVKNESAVIRRCLESVRPIIDHWAICDTGSTDGTQAIIRKTLASVPGVLRSRPWVDFAHNRTESLELARSRADYTLVIDADDVLEIPKGFALPSLNADQYFLTIRSGGHSYDRIQLVKNTLPWRYRGVLHEFIDCPNAGPPSRLPLIMRVEQDGARRQDASKTYRQDAKLLEEALRTETDPFMSSRYTFYLAQSYRDSGEPEKAVAAYVLRTSMGFWRDEIYISFYEAARLRQKDKPDIALHYLHRAAALAPDRAEALHAQSQLLRTLGRNEEGFRVAQRGIELTPPVGALFLEQWIYDYGLLDEYAINAYWANHHTEAIDACLRILKRDDLPADVRARVTENANCALRKIGPSSTPNTPPAEVRTVRSRLPEPAPRVMIAILAKQKEPMLPLYLRCIEALDYPRESIVLHIRTNDSSDRTAQLLREWTTGLRGYAGIELDDSSVDRSIAQYGVHEWNAARFRLLGRLRTESLQRALHHDCAHYFTADVDNFVRPETLRELVSLDLPIVSPLLRCVDPDRSRYSNYHSDVDDNGYFLDRPRYDWILERRITGVIEVPVAHCTYAIRADVIPLLSYADDTERYEYVIFSDSARKAGVPQYLDNRQVYGCLTLDPTTKGAERAVAFMGRFLTTPAERSVA